MKYLFFTLFALFFHNFSYGQQTLRFKFVNEYNGTQYKEMAVLVNNDAFLYESKQTDKRIKAGEGFLYSYFEDYRWHYDFKTSTVTQHRIVDNGIALISPHSLDSKLNWLLINEERTILGYRCFKAILPINEAPKGAPLVVGGGDIIAWYTPDIPVSVGINGLHGLPGMLLAYEGANSNAFIFYAISVEKTETSIQKPTEGIEVPQELIEKSSPSKKELKKYMEVKDK